MENHLNQNPWSLLLSGTLQFSRGSLLGESEYISASSLLILCNLFFMFIHCTFLVFSYLCFCRNCSRNLLFQFHPGIQFSLSFPYLLVEFIFIIFKYPVLLVLLDPVLVSSELPSLPISFDFFQKNHFLICYFIPLCPCVFSISSYFACLYSIFPPLSFPISF